MTKKKQAHSLLVLAVWFGFLCAICTWNAIAHPNADNPGGELIVAHVPAPSLEPSLYHIPTQQTAAVYLPPSYKTSTKRFPAIYFLTGFGDQIQMYTQWGTYQGFSLKEAMDRLISEGKINEMIVVIPNGLQFMWGAFYVNSPLNGNWEDYIVTDLTGYVDKNFRTLPAAASRGIAGHSMGGFGAFNLAMRHPQIFGAVYALSPGLAAPDGLKSHISYAETGNREKVIAILEELSKMPACEAYIKFMSYIHSLTNRIDIGPLFAFAYGAAFAPNPGGKPPHIDYPFEKKGNNLVLRPRIWEKLESGFADWDKKINRFEENFRKLRYIAIDFGKADEHAWIPPGCEYVSELLKAKNITHDLVPFSGKHEDKLRERIENFMLPMLSGILKSEGENRDASSAVDVARLSRHGENWKIIDQKGNPQKGSLSLHHDKWLMYFLHWRPLGEERREVSLEDTRKLLLSFWGSNMPFTLTGNEGQLTVAGHPACFVEGTIYNGNVRTIFIVWNCPQTGRQFIADCNINQARGTATSFLDLQRQIALTTCCHGQTISVDNPLLIQEVKSDKFNLSFRIPPDWRTREFPNPKWFPTGMTPTNGTLWTLLTTSEKHIELAWDQSDLALTDEHMEFFLNKLRQNPIQLDGLTMNIKELRLEEVRLVGGRLIGNGVYKYAAQVNGKELELPYIFRAFLWKDGPRTHFLMASMAALKEMWQIPNDLTPSPEAIDRFVREEVLPAVAK